MLCQSEIFSELVCNFFNFLIVKTVYCDLYVEERFSLVEVAISNPAPEVLDIVVKLEGASGTVDVGSVSELETAVFDAPESKVAAVLRECPSCSCLTLSLSSTVFRRSSSSNRSVSS